MSNDGLLAEIRQIQKELQEIKQLVGAKPNPLPEQVVDQFFKNWNDSINFSSNLFQKKILNPAKSQLIELLMEKKQKNDANDSNFV